MVLQMAVQTRVSIADTRIGIARMAGAAVGRCARRERASCSCRHEPLARGPATEISMPPLTPMVAWVRAEHAPERIIARAGPASLSRARAGRFGRPFPHIARIAAMADRKRRKLYLVS